MSFIAYENKRFQSKSLAIIKKANEIIKEYSAQGFILTLRQLYYQFVARDLIANTMQSYHRLGSIINNGRLSGLIDWEAIEDRTRWLECNPHWNNITEILEGCAAQYRIDLWARQPYRVEVWIEKQALVGVIERVCKTFDVPFFACRGYVSQSEQWRAGRRFKSYRAQNQNVVILHLGDHDPSGIDMTDDNQKRLLTFAESDVEVRRIALNMDQVEEYGPPPNPAKLTDSRFESYAAKFGTESWELDALTPGVITELIRSNVDDLIDQPLWDEAMFEQNEGRDRLRELADQEEIQS